MQFPFKNMPRMHMPEPKNCTVLKVSNETGDVLRTLMVCLTKTEAVGIARAGNTYLLKRKIPARFVVKEEKYD